MPAKRPNEQHQVLARTPLACELPNSMFSEDEILKLQQYGTWLVALADGVIEPETLAQKQFVQAARGQKDSTAEFEKLFAKYRLYKTLCADHDSENAGRTPGRPRPAKKRVQARIEKHPEPQKPQHRSQSGRRKPTSAASSRDKERVLRDSLERPKKVAAPQPEKPEVTVRQQGRTRSSDPHSEPLCRSPSPPPQSEPSEGYGGKIERYDGPNIPEFEPGSPRPGWIGSEAAWNRMRGGYRNDGK